MLSIRNEDGEEALTENEIVHNAMAIMFAGYDTSSVLITFIIRFLSMEPAIYAAVVQGIHTQLSLSLQKVFCSENLK